MKRFNLAALACAVAAMAMFALPAAAQSVVGTPGAVTPGFAPCYGALAATPTCVDSTHPLPVGSGAAIVSTNASTTVATGTTYQTVFAASTARRGCLIQNPTTATEVLNVRQGGAAVFTLPIGAVFNCASPAGVVVSDLVEVTAATTSHAFTAVSQ